MAGAGQMYTEKYCGRITNGAPTTCWQVIKLKLCIFILKDFAMLSYMSILAYTYFMRL